MKGALVVVDRWEGAADLLSHEFGIPLRSLVTLQDIRRHHDAEAGSNTL